MLSDHSNQCQNLWLEKLKIQFSETPKRRIYYMNANRISENAMYLPPSYSFTPLKCAHEVDQGGDGIGKRIDLCS